MKRVASRIFKLRVPLLIILTIITIFLGYEASQLKIQTDFSKMIPQTHEYNKNYEPFKEFFGGGNQIKVSVSLKEGTILTEEFLTLLRKINEDIMFVKGVNRLTVRSLASPETRFVLISEEGFDMGPVVPHKIPADEKGLKKINDNIILAKLKGRLVSMDLKSALITGDIYETGVDYLYVYRQLNEIRDKYTTDNISLHINGFAMVVGFVNEALPKTLGLFGVTMLITVIILFRCFRYLRLAILPLISGLLAVLWSLGIARLIGMNLDPMTTIVPFLVLAIGASHGIQMVKRYLEECANHHEGYDAAMNALAGLMIPGVVALLTDAIGFLTILFVPIGVIQDLAISSCIGVVCIIVSNILILTLILSFFPNMLRRKLKADEEVIAPSVNRALRYVADLTHGKNCRKVIVVSIVLLIIGIFTARTTTVGDINPGEPLLWEDSLYNQDAAKLMRDFMLGIDYMSIIVTSDEDGTCKMHDVLLTMADYEWEVTHVPGVTVVLSPLLLCRSVNEMLHEGDMRWRELPKVKRELAVTMAYAGSTDDTIFMNMGCQHLNIRVFLSDHKGDTLRRVVKMTKEFIASHPMERGKFVLAGGNAGVMAATNEMVAKAQVPMLGLIYLSIFILVMVMFRDIKAPFFIVAPLALVSILSTAFMKFFGVGLNVNTLPVASLGVGIGVDYSIYIYSRLSEERKVAATFGDAVVTTLHTTGAAVLYTALTLAGGVLTWYFSNLKFQADMGVLLGFIFIANMIGAMVLLPALIYIWDYKIMKKSSE